MTIRRLGFAVVLAFVVFILGFSIGALYGNTSRRQLLASKLHGRLPDVSWLETARFLVPLIWKLPGPLAHLPFVHMEQTRQQVCPALWRTPLGPFWGRRNEGPALADLMREQVIDHIYERGPVVVRKGDIVLDAGAHVGTFSRFALNRGARRVIAFEPEPTNIACFQSNFEKELRSGQVVLVEAALWEHSGTLKFYIPPKEGNSLSGLVVTSDDPHTIPVLATTIDETAARLNLDRVDFIKMDIEGSERYALRGGRRTLARFAPRMALSIEHCVDDAVAIPRSVLEAKPDYHWIPGDKVLYFYY